MLRILTGTAALAATAAALIVLPGTAQAARGSDFECDRLHVSGDTVEGIGCEPRIMAPLWQFRIWKKEASDHTYRCTIGHISSPGTVHGEGCRRV
ncbi:hypothetical protein [Actinomadura gamaensis]|uniref:Secreted protein n=1 Tax=Actinomadura gamaensis TaxID=1763541 RepID=A0ABV9TST0_9ACTN